MGLMDRWEVEYEYSKSENTLKIEIEQLKQKIAKLEDELRKCKNEQDNQNEEGK